MPGESVGAVHAGIDASVGPYVSVMISPLVVSAYRAMNGPPIMGG